MRLGRLPLYRSRRRPYLLRQAGWCALILCLCWCILTTRRSPALSGEPAPYTNLEYGFVPSPSLFQAGSRYSSLAASLAGGHCPVRHIEPEVPIIGDDHTIFVSIASYRDPLCAYGLESLFRNAANPRHVHVGVVEQHDPALGDFPCVKIPSWMQPNSRIRDRSGGGGGDSKDASSIELYLAHPNIKLMRMHPRFAKGPAHTRYLASLMYGQESYFMMVDSHSYFVRDWDLRALCMLSMAEETSEAPRGVVLGHHPPEWTVDVSPELTVEQFHRLMPSTLLEVKGSSHPCMRYTCGCAFGRPEYGFPIVSSINVNRTAAPRPSPFIGAGFFFARGSFLSTVPFDPHLKQVFHGEELALSARLWTSGYDLFSPHLDVVYHYYARKEAPKFFDDVWTIPEATGGERVESVSAQSRPPSRQDEENRSTSSLKDGAAMEQSVEYETSMRRLQFLFKSTHYVPKWERGAHFQFERMVPENATDVHQEDVQYGMGSERTLSSYWRHAGIDLNERRWTGQSKWSCWYGSWLLEHPEQHVDRCDT